MEINWNLLEQVRPANEQMALTYFFDKGFDLKHFEVLTYYTKGSIIDVRIKTPVCCLEDFLKGEEIIAEEDGFYFAITTEEGHLDYLCYRDQITHWIGVEMIEPS